MFKFITNWFQLSNLRPPEVICFDHLYSEYLAVKASITDEEEKKFVDALQAEVQNVLKNINTKDKQEGPDIWSRLYYFELIISKCLPVEKLRTKIMRLRLDYRAVAGQKEFDDYMASKPPDLQSPPVHTEPPETQQEYEKGLREDLTDLLGRMYLEYSILPVRETRLTDLTWLAAKLSLFSLIILLLILSVLFLIPLGYEMVNADADGLLARLNVARSSANLSALTVFVVVVTGAMGGFVSALQRIQSPPSEGDSLYNLSLLFHGSKSVFVSPISGSIFAILLYLMFTSGILTGAFFPAIYTPEGKYSKAAIHPPETQSDTATANSSPGTNTSTTPAANSNTPAGVNANSAAGANSIANSHANMIANTASNTSAKNPNLLTVEPSQTPKPTPTATPTATATPKPTPIATPSPTPKPVPEQGLNVFDFLAGSGPGGGKDYALLIIWCFIAGFAERFVPDALDRLISNETSAGR